MFWKKKFFIDLKFYNNLQRVEWGLQQKKSKIYGAAAEAFWVQASTFFRL